MSISNLMQPMENDKQEILRIFSELKVKINENTYEINNLAKEIDELKETTEMDHDELLRLLVMRDFFWKIAIKTGVPLMFIMFGIGWAVGKFAQHISSVLGT